MTISKDLFLSILSMDAYNRGYGAGIANLGGLGSGIGAATVGKDAQQLLSGGTAQAASFYAIAYNDPTYGTIISYRGTDSLPADLPVDLPVSFGGSYQQTQIALAQKFFNAVDAANGASPMLLTGHSLGGALAGMIGALNGANSVLVDHIGFNAAITNLVAGWNSIRPYLPLQTFDDVIAKYAHDNGITGARGLISFCWAAIIVCFATTASPQDARSSGSPTFIVPTEQLSQQTVWPFRMSAWVVDSQHPWWDKYKRTLETFPSTQSCLLPNAKRQDGWDLAAVNWAGFRDQRDIEVCLFRIADSLGPPERMKDWFIGQGFKEIHGPQQVIATGRDSKETETWFSLEAFLDIAVFEERVHFESSVFRSILAWLLPKGTPYSRDQEMVLGYSKSGRIIVIQSTRRGG